MIYCISVILVICFENGLLLRDTLKSLKIYDSDKNIKKVLSRYNFILFGGNIVLQSGFFLLFHWIMSSQLQQLIPNIIVLCISLIVGYVISCFLSNAYLYHFSKHK